MAKLRRQDGRGALFVPKNVSWTQVIARRDEPQTAEYPKNDLKNASAKSRPDDLW